MTKRCQKHPGVKAVQLCMGCGKWFCEKCLVEVKDVKYCAECAEGIGEDFRAIAEQGEADRHLPGTVQMVSDEVEDRWEKGFGSARMIDPTKKRVSRLERPVNLEGVVAGIGRRFAARIIDQVAVVLAIAILFFLAMGMVSEENLAIAYLAAAALGLVGSFLLRLLMTMFCGQTVGRLAVGIKVVSEKGKPAGFVLSLGRTVFDMLFDLTEIFLLPNLFLVRPAKAKGSLSDRIVGTQVVDARGLKDRSQDAIYEEDRASILKRK